MKKFFISTAIVLVLVFTSSALAAEKAPEKRLYFDRSWAEFFVNKGVALVVRDSEARWGDTWASTYGQIVGFVFVGMENPGPGVLFVFDPTTYRYVWACQLDGYEEWKRDINPYATVIRHATRHLRPMPPGYSEPFIDKALFSLNTLGTTFGVRYQDTPLLALGLCVVVIILVMVGLRALSAVVADIFTVVTQQRVVSDVLDRMRKGE